MDYKFIILLLVIVGLILFFTREIENMKSEMNDKLDKITEYIDNSSKNTLTKIQNGFGNCVNKIKVLNGDYIEQVRKMNDYGTQPITNMSNHYTDTDSQGNGMRFAALSDCKAFQQCQPKNVNPDSFYVSDDEPRKITKNSDHFKVKLPSTEENITSVKQSQLKKSKFANLNTDLIDDENTHITTETITSKKHYSPNTKESQNLETNLNLKEHTLVSNSTNKNDQITQNNKGENIFNDKIDDIEDDNNNIDDISNSENKSEESTQSHEDSDEISIDKESDHSSEYESITFVNKHQKVETVNKIKDPENDEISVKSMTLNKLTLDKLLTKDKYTSENLKRIAKNLAIPIFYKDGTTRKQLKKDELYDKIKLHLSGNN